MSNPILDSDDEDEGEVYGPPEPPTAPAVAPPISVSAPVKAPSSGIDWRSYLANKQSALRDAQSTANSNQLLAGIARASGTLAHSAYGATTPVDSKAYDSLDSAAQTPVNELVAQQKGETSDISNESAETKAEQESDATDPDSDQSKTFRESFKANFPKLAAAYGDKFEQIAASDAPNITKMAEVKSAIDQRAEASKERATSAKEKTDAQSAANDQKASEKSSADQDKMIKAVKTDLDPNGGRAGEMGALQKKIDQAVALEGLVAQTHGNPDQRQLEELAIGAQNMLSGGNGSAEQVKQLVPRSAWGDAKKTWEWFSNNPQGTDQQEFVKRMSETIETEKQIRSDQLKSAQVQRLSGHQRARDTYPDAFNEVLQGYGIDPNQIVKGRYVSQSSDQQSPQSSTVERKTSDGKVALFDAASKKFLRYK